MSTHIRSTEKIAVFFCKDFQKLLRKMKDKEPSFLAKSPATRWVGPLSTGFRI